MKEKEEDKKPFPKGNNNLENSEKMNNLQPVNESVKTTNELSKNSSEKVEKINKQIQEILNENAIDQIKYLLIELSKIYLSKLPKVETDIIAGSIKIKFDNLVLSTNLEKLILKLLYKYKNQGLNVGDYDGKISLFNGKVSLNFFESNDYFQIYLNVKKGEFLNNKELQLIKIIFENEIFNNLVDAGKENLTSEDLIKFADKFKEKIIFEERENNYYLRILGNIDINNFKKLAQKLVKQNNRLYIKILPYGLDSQTYEINIVYIKNRSNIKEFRILSGLRANKTNLELSNISKDIWEIFIKPFIEELIYFINKEKTNKIEAYIDDLLNIGVKITLPENKDYNLEELELKYGFVGYEDIKEEILTNVIKPRKEKDSYLKFANKNVPHIGSEILPNAVLFWGPPGTGKTTMSRIIGQFLKYPFVYLPVQSIMSKWYGESERILNGIFKRVEKIGQYYGGVILMIDEIDEIGRNRDNSHEATARLTGILLRKLDGLEKIENVLLIGATNRKDGLDPALLSRFGEQFYFRHPNAKEIKAIFSYYLPFSDKLEEEFLKKFEGKLTGRDIKAICKKIARKMLKEGKETIEMQKLKELIKEYIMKD